MIKLVFCLRRKPGMTLAEFQDYWLNKHGPLVRSHAKTLRIRRYVQTHTLDDPGAQQALARSRGAPQGYDGVAELWWDSREEMAAGVATPEGRAASIALLEDERKFIDHTNSPLWLAEEHEMLS
ncbi:MAG TPA: EthD domain-containing protein [Dehalococcoidia bacterium]|nr:EthD domain-containing protein [Dehalococcoidia bacterium]